MYHKRSRLKPISDKSRAKRDATNKEWFALNPSDENGQWKCYLHISPNCYGWVNASTLKIEHVKSKVRRPDLKYTVSNLKPACGPCNELKGSRDVEEL